MIIPLNKKQLNSLPQSTDKTEKPFRVLANGCAINICTGIECSKGSNIMYHPIYWDRPKIFITAVLKALKENNPKVLFRITYH